MHVPIPAVFSLFILPFSFFLSFFLSVLLLLVSYYSLAVSYSPFGLFFSWVHLYRCLLLSYHGFFPLGAPAPLGPPFSTMVISSFYSELMQWDFSLLPLGLHQLFLVSCGYPFRTTHQLIGCLDHCHCSVHVCCTITHFTTKFPFVCSCCIPLPHYLTLWHASDGPNHLLLLLGKIPFQQGIFPKEVMAGNQI